MPEAREIVYNEPSLLALRLRAQANVTLLESVMRRERLGRYSFLACNPKSTIGDFGMIDRILAENQQPHLPGLPPFQGGLAGYISYDFGRRLEPNARVPDFAPICDDIVLHHYDTVIATDHMQERAWIISTDPAQADHLERLLNRKAAATGSAVIAGFQSNFTRETYESAVAKTIDYILAGDIFQANITQCLSAPIPENFDALAFYCRLRETNPATFAAFLDYGDIQIASSSPERLISVENNAVEARPIKGTRRRDADPARDAALIAELAASRKDRAENVMIVDLLRSDLSRVCAPGSVKVPMLCGLETYASVHHLTSVITGELRDGKTTSDLIAAIFPGGSITGAPKIRAMEIVAEIEQAPRGVYCGAIGYLGFNGRSDLNIAIRTAQFSKGVARVQAGGGITARSQAPAEYEESLTKISRILQAFAP